MRANFDEQLNVLHKSLVKMGNLCESAISISAKLLQNAPDTPISKVVSLEREIDQMEREIEHLCMQLLLRQQPVAKDLRVISAALKMISDMERIGDQAADIAELVPYVLNSGLESSSHIDNIAACTVSMVTDSINAFVQQDQLLAKKVIEKDDTADQLFCEIKEELFESIVHHDPHGDAILDLLMIAKYFERIGDHAVNLAEHVIYAITGSHVPGSDKHPQAD